MREFIVLCFSALAAAAPQGYNYQQSTSSATTKHTGYEQIIQTSLAPPLQQHNQQQQPHQQQSPQIPAPIQYLAPHSTSSNHHEPYIGQQQQFIPQMMILSQRQQNVALQLPSTELEHQPTKPDVLISKRFFIHSAPEEEEEELQEKILTVGTPRKNYNVVFIKAPAKSSKRTSIKITPAVNEDKTVIYVLSKKTDAADIDAQIQEVATTTTKPEVYFIKYKTPEEAVHAQEKIQAEYDHLGGSTQISNEGIAPVTSVIGALEGKDRQQNVLQPTSVVASVTPIVNSHMIQILPSAIESEILNSNNGYLPPNYYY